MCPPPPQLPPTPMPPSPQHCAGVSPHPPSPPVAPLPCLQYEIALFDRVREMLGIETSRLNWTCLEWYQMIGHVESGDGACDIVVAGLDVSTASLQKGVSFTLPTLRCAAHKQGAGLGAGLGWAGLGWAGLGWAGTCHTCRALQETVCALLQA